MRLSNSFGPPQETATNGGVQFMVCWRCSYIFFYYLFLSYCAALPRYRIFALGFAIHSSFSLGGGEFAFKAGLLLVKSKNTFFHSNLRSGQ